MSLRTKLSVVSALLLVGLVAGCSSPTDTGTPNTGEPTIESYEDGKLTVVFPHFPHAGFVEGTDPTNPDGGYWVDLANKLGEDLGLEVQFDRIDFTAMIGGQAKNYDITATTLSFLPERVEAFDMTMPLWVDHLGIVTRKGTKASTAEEIRELQMGSCAACDTYEIITNVIKPNNAPLAFDDDLQKYTSLASGQIDAALGNLPTILAKVATPEFDQLEPLCQLPEEREYGWAMNKGAALYPAVEKLLAQYKADGTLDKMIAKNVFPTLGGVDPASIATCASFK